MCPAELPRRQTLHRPPCLSFCINYDDDITPCHHLKPSRVLPLSILPLILPVVTVFSNAHLLIIWPNNDVCLFLICVYNVLLSLVFSSQSLLVICTGYSFHSSQKPHLSCLQFLPILLIDISRLLQCNKTGQINISLRIFLHSIKSWASVIKSIV